MFPTFRSLSPTHRVAMLGWKMSGLCGATFCAETSSFQPSLGPQFCLAHFLSDGGPNLVRWQSCCSTKPWFGERCFSSRFLVIADHMVFWWCNNLRKDHFISRSTVVLFPACQVRVVRFYQSCSSPLPPPSSSFSSFSSSASSSSSTTSASTSTSTVALPTLGQSLRLLRTSVRTAGPQPGTFPAQCAPLDLNLGPS